MKLLKIPTTLIKQNIMKTFLLALIILLLIGLVLGQIQDLKVRELRVNQKDNHMMKKDQKTKQEEDVKENEPNHSNNNGCLGCGNKLSKEEMTNPTDEFVNTLNKALQLVLKHENVKKNYKFIKILGGTKQVVAGIRYRINFDVCNESKSSCDGYKIDFVSRAWADNLDIFSLMKVKNRIFDENYKYDPQKDMKELKEIDVTALEENSIELPKMVDSTKSKTGHFAGLFIVLFIITILGGAFYYLNKRSKTTVVQ